MTTDLAALFREHHAALVRVLYRRTGDHDRAEDIAQETFARAVAAPPRNPRPWLFAVALNLVREDGRKAVRQGRRLELYRAESPQSAPAADQAMDRSDNVRAVQDALATLGERDREALLLKAEGFNYDEIAETLGLAKGAVGTTLSRARRKLVEAYRTQEGEMSHLDEGTIQMLLDGELDTVERRRVERHVAECAACAANLAEARELLDEADRLVAVLEVPARAPRERAMPRRRALVRTLAWAASIVIAVGVGYWGRGPTPLATNTTVLQDEEARPQPNAAPPPLAARDEPVRAMLPPESGARRDTDAGKRTGEAKAASPPSPTITARAERAAQPEALAADQAIGRWRVISMEEAVRLLGGQLRLIDGLTPDRVETGPGTAVAGADPALPLVRVVYAAGAVVLDQQRPMNVADARQGNAAKAVGGVAQESSATAWRQQGEIRFVVTGNVSTDSLRTLAERVR